MNKYIPHTKYICYRCNSFETSKFMDIKKHFLRKNPCKKKSDIILLSDDQLLVMTIIPHHNENHCIDNDEIEYLSNSNKIYKNKLELFNELDIIEKNKDKKCKYCNIEFNLVSDLKHHIIKKCFLDEINKRLVEQDNQNNIKMIDNSVNSNINSNINNSYNTNNTTNNYNNYNIYLNIPIPFEEDWDITNISKAEKEGIIISQFMYRRLLQSILDNEKNSNVIMEKDKKLGMVYLNHNKKYIQMKADEIVEQTMNKLNTQLNDINEDNTESLKTVKKYSKKIIQKKYKDYKVNKDIKAEVGNIVCNIYEENNEKALEMAKNVKIISDKNIQVDNINTMKKDGKNKFKKIINEYKDNDKKQYQSSDDDNDYIYDSDGEIKY